MSFLRRLESRFDRWAIPHLLLILGMLQALVFMIGLVTRPPAGGVSPLLEMMTLDRTAVLAGDYWRLGTFLFLPGFLPKGVISIIFMFFTVSILRMIGQALEQEWGLARTNLYVLFASLALGLANWFLGTGGGLSESALLYASLFLAFAAIMPDYELQLFGIIPVKAKWLAWLTAAGLIYQFIYDPAIRWSVVAALVPYFLYVAPTWWQNRQQDRAAAVRKKKFVAQQRPEDEAFHQCAFCAKNDLTDPQMEFRVLEDEREICGECLAAGKAG
jgi:hypothetical protein